MRHRCLLVPATRVRVDENQEEGILHFAGFLGHVRDSATL
jgi:hypothetical protein